MSTVKKLAESLKRLRNVGIALSAEKNISKFFRIILDEGMFFTNADAGTIYTVSDDQKSLDFKVICTLSKKLHLGVADTSKWPSVPLYDENGEKRMTNFVSYVTHTGEPLSIQDVYNQDLFDASGTKKYDSNNDYRSVSMAAIPLKNHENVVLGVVQLINALNERGEVIAFSNRNIMMLSSLASQAAIALSNKKLIDSLENLLYQFIKSIATAIDRKSKNTGGHINRVATLSEMLSKEIQNDKKYYPDIHFSDDELQEISLAGWMHDVGKITTPVYVQDKGKKLETIIDRLELVNLRFDLVEKVIENDILGERNDNKEDLPAILKKVETYRKFVAKCNTGGEFMRDEDLALLKEIFAFRYKSGDKEYFLITEDEHRNLSIRHGTLLWEEILKMRDHAQVSYEMLNELTFPRKFKNVPLYASAHHEKLNGRGYPNELTEDQLPLQARIIAVADVYEALTASDRPYKLGKKLSETFKILGFMAKDRDIDAKLLNLLIDSELYMEYALKYMKPEQIDEVDFDKIKAMYSEVN
ncbi:MAG: HD domain-containing phosphohydrolase [Candidatus Cloacimonadales bacterium]|nr:HD domain-containing phosphohydrolase [Candidatus Cloacimonadales bacterium]